MSRKRDIAAHFGSATASYDHHAQAQRHAADALLARLDAALAGRAPRRALEFGCGTGYLSRGLLARWPDCDWLISDISAAMLASCHQRLGTTRGRPPRFAVLDAEHPQLSTSDGDGFELIASSLAFQWFERPGDALARLYALLTPGGRLAIATLGADSFAEWHASHRALGLPCGVPAYPDEAALTALLPAAGRASLSAERHVIRYRDGRDFLHALKGIGAALPGAGYRSLPAGTLRRLLRHFDRGETQITYHLLYLLLEKPR